MSMPKIVCALRCQRYYLTCHDKNDVMTVYLNELIMFHYTRSLLYTEMCSNMPHWNVIYIIVIVLRIGKILGLKIALHNM